MTGTAVRWWVAAALAFALVGCSKSKPGTPTGQGTPPVTGAAQDGGAPLPGTVPVTGGTRAAGATAAGPAAELLASLRQAARPKIASWVGLGDVNELSFYDIDLQVDAETGAFQATEKLDFDNRTGETLTEVAFHVYGNGYGKEGAPPPVTVDSVSVDGTAAVPSHPGPTTWVVPLPAPLAAGKRATFELRFTGQPPVQEPGQTGLLRQGLDMVKNMLGLGGGGIEGYGILSVGEGIVSLAAWYPAVARWYADEKRFETEEPSGIGDVGTEDLANYRVRVRAPGPATVAASGVELARGGTATDVTYGGVALRDFTVLISRTYATASRTAGETKVSVFVPQGREAFAEKILDYAVAALEFYERRFGPYTLTELDVAAAPLLGGVGGVEFPGIVTVATMLLQDLAESLGPLAPQGMNRLPILDEMVEFVVVHEVAHQWWNGLVGSDSEHHPFIDEGMAQYSSVLYFEDRYGAERAEKTGDRQVKLNYLVYRMMGNADAAVDRATGDFSGPLEYAALVYGKGPYFYPAVRRAVGDDVFWRTLRRYYDENLYKVAAPESFARIAGEVSGRTDELLGLHRHWFLEAHGDEDLGQANLTQLLELVIGDAAGMGNLLGQLQGGGDGGLDLSQLMGLMQAMGGVAGDAGAGGMPDLDQILALVQSMQGGAGDAGTGGPVLVVLPGGPDGGGMGGMGQMFALARQILEPLGAQDPNIAKVLDLLGRVERGELVSPAELLEALQVALQSLNGLLGGADGGGGEWMQLLQLLNMMGPGAAL